MLLERLPHYFETYKVVPGARLPSHVERSYGEAHAAKVILAAITDYQRAYAAATAQSAP